MTTVRLLTIFIFAAQFAMGAVPGTVVGWGENISGEAMGVPSRTESTGAVTVAGCVLTNPVSISAGFGYGLALKPDGTVVHWGSVVGGIQRSTNGTVLVDGKILDQVVGISAGGFRALALKKDGTVVSLGQGSLPGGLGNVVALAAGQDYSLALKGDGTIVCWGDPFLSGPPENLGEVTAIAVAADIQQGRALALRKDGTVISWELVGRTYSKVSGATNAIAVAAGENHYLALRKDGTVMEWGEYAGPLPGSLFYNPNDNHPPANTESPDIPSHPVMIKGKKLSDVVAIAAGGTRSLALKRDGTVVEWGKGNYRRREAAELGAPSGLRGVVAISAGNGFSLAITTNNPPLPNVRTK